MTWKHLLIQGPTLVGFSWHPRSGWGSNPSGGGKGDQLRPPDSIIILGSFSFPD